MTAGNPKLTLRLEPHVMELLRERAGEDSAPGRGGGVAHYVRRLIHQHLELPEPEVYAAEPSPRKRKKPTTPRSSSSSS